MPEPQDHFRLSQRVRHRKVGEEGVMVQLDSGRVIVVNEVGLYIVDLLREQRSRDELVSAISQEFAVEAAEAEADLDHYLAELAAEALLETGS